MVNRSRQFHREKDLSVRGGRLRHDEEKYKSLATYVESGIEGIRRTGLKVLALQGPVM